MTNTYVGIDIAKHQLDLAVWGCPQEDDRLANDRQGIEAVCQRLCDLEPDLIVMEATGGLEVPLATTLQAAGLPVAVVNPRRARAFGRASGQLAKTDPAWMPGCWPAWRLACDRPCDPCPRPTGETCEPSSCGGWYSTCGVT